MRVYLDCCCYNRPYDGVKQEKVQLESEAILSILKKGQFGKLEIYGSDILDYEIQNIRNPIKRNRVEQLYKTVSANRHIYYTESIDKCSENIMKNSEIRLFDSLHIASAVSVDADYMLTTDNKLEKQANKLELDIKVVNPLKFILEVF